MTVHSTTAPQGFSNISGARGGTRTPTPLPASGPKPGASTNFATRAQKQKWEVKVSLDNMPKHYDHPLEIGQPAILA